VFIFPLIATTVSFLFSALLFKQYFQKKRSYQLAWALALIMFGIASLAETIALGGTGWNNLLVKTWYLFGAVLVVGYLAVGSLYVADTKTASRLLIIGVALTLVGPVLPMIIFSKTVSSTEKLPIALMLGGISMFLIIFTKVWGRPGTAWLATMIIASALAVALLLNAPIKAAEVAEKGWEAMDRSLALKTMVVSINTLGSIILIGGALLSAWALIRKNIMRERAIGSILIGAGASISAAGGYIHGYFGYAGFAVLSISVTLGVSVMFLGFLAAGRQANTAPAPSPTRAKSGSPA
jgi:hypothetical protein